MISTNPTSQHPTLRALVAEDDQELFALVQSQGHDLDAFAWRRHIGSVSDELAFIQWAKEAESTQSAICRAVVAQGRIAGCVSLYQPHTGSFSEAEPTMQMGYWIGREFRRQGFAVQSMKALMEEASSILPDGSTAGIRTRSQNAASIQCAVKLGLLLAQTGLPSQFDTLDTDNLYVGPLSNSMQKQPAPPWIQTMKFPFNTDCKAIVSRAAIPQTPSQIIAELSKLHHQGQLCIPALIELNSPLGCICISTDLTTFLLNHPKALMVQRNADFLNELLTSAHQVETAQVYEHFKLDPFSSHMMQHYSNFPSDCLKALCMDLCPDWIDQPPKVDLCRPRTHEKLWRGDTAIFEATISCHEQAYSPQTNPSDADAGMAKAIKAIYQRRDDQACNLIAALGGPTHCAFYEPGALPDYPGLWAAFQAEREAMILKLETKSTASRSTQPRM